MSQDVSVGENRISGLRPGFAYHRRRGHHLGVSELQVHSARALAGLNDHLHRPAGVPLSGLSDQERRLLALLGEGLTNKQIAARMFLAEKTVKNYVSRLLAKLGMERRTQAAVFASKLDQERRPAD